MRLVIDANILFAALIKNGLTSDILFKHELYAPMFILEESKIYEHELQTKTFRTIEEFELIFKLIRSHITFVNLEHDLFFIQKAKNISPDPNDVLYFALALKLNCSIWSNDKKLKEQKEIVVYSTKDLLDK